MLRNVSSFHLRGLIEGLRPNKGELKRGEEETGMAPESRLEVGDDQTRIQLVRLLGSAGPKLLGRAKAHSADRKKEKRRGEGKRRKGPLGLEVGCGPNYIKTPVSYTHLTLPTNVNV